MRKSILLNHFQISTIFIFQIAIANDACLVPDNAVIPTEIIEHQLPSDYSAGLIWFQAVTQKNPYDESLKGEAKITIDYEEVIESCPPNAPKQIFVRNYDIDSGPMSPNYGGLFLRNPWFDTNDHLPISNSEIQGGNLTITVSQFPDKVAHWWTDRFPVDSLCSYFAKVRFKIEGEVSFQIGSDWWRVTWHPDCENDPLCVYNGYDETCQKSNNCEAWVSDWFSNTEDRYAVVTVPLNDRCHTFKPEELSLPFLFLLLD